MYGPHVRHTLTLYIRVSREPSCTNNAMEFAYSQSSSIGVFAGAEVHQHGITKVVLEKLLEYVREKAVSKTTVVQVSANVPSSCGTVTNKGTLVMWI
jgi:precorrin-4 methylase